MITKIAINIKTEIWYSIVELLKKDNWIIISEYNLFDKAIDFDLYEFEKNGIKIVMAWDNWFEGEIKCSSKNLIELEKRVNTKFVFGKTNNLYLTNIEKIKNWINK